jgi:hypothetical protein
MHTGMTVMLRAPVLPVVSGTGRSLTED